MKGGRLGAGRLGVAHSAHHALVIPLPVHDLVAAAHSDDAVARALLAKDNPVLAANAAAQRADATRHTTARAIVTVLAARGLSPTEAQRSVIASTDDLTTLERWLGAAVTCSSVDALLADA